MKFSVLIFVLLLLTPSALFAQSRVEAEVLGWRNDRVVLKVERQGVLEKEDGTTEDYFKEEFQVYGRSEGKTIATRLKTTPSKDQKKLEFPDSAKASKGVLSPNSHFLVNVLSLKRIERKTHQARCVLTHQLRLLDQNTSRIYTMFSVKTSSEFEKGRFPTCPKVKEKVVWKSDNSALAIVLGHQDSLKVYNISLAESQSKMEAKRFQPFLNPAIRSQWLDEEPLWKSIFLGEDIEKIPIISKKDYRAALALAFLKIRSGEISKGLKIAKKASKKLKKNRLNETIQSIVYGEAKKLRRASKVLDRIIRKGTLSEIIDAANMFRFFDLDIAAELYVAALSRKQLKEKESVLVYTLLLRTLLDGGNMDAATEVVAKLGALQDEDSLQVLRYRVLRREPSILPVIQSFVVQHPQRCGGYLLLGRALGYKNSRQAMVQYRSAMHCDPNLGEAMYLLGDMQKRAGRQAEANILFKQYRVVSPPRRGDSIRDSRRQYAYDMTHPKIKDDLIEK